MDKYSIELFLSFFRLYGLMTAVFTAVGIYFFLLKGWWHQLTADQRQRRNGAFAIYAGIIAGVAFVSTMLVQCILSPLIMLFGLHHHGNL